VPLETTGGRALPLAGETKRERAMIISKSVVVAVLRERGQEDRAAFVEKELPDQIESTRHSGLLAMLHLDPVELVDPSPSSSSSSA